MICLQCSVECGGGTRQRQVFCFNGTSQVDISLCDSGNRPTDSEICNVYRCESQGGWASCCVFSLTRIQCTIRYRESCLGVCIHNRFSRFHLSSANWMIRFDQQSGIQPTDDRPKLRRSERQQLCEESKFYWSRQKLRPKCYVVSTYGRAKKVEDKCSFKSAWLSENCLFNMFTISDRRRWSGTRRNMIPRKYRQDVALPNGASYDLYAMSYIDEYYVHMVFSARAKLTESSRFCFHSVQHRASERLTSCQHQL